MLRPEGCFAPVTVPTTLGGLALRSTTLDLVVGHLLERIALFDDIDGNGDERNRLAPFAFKLRVENTHLGGKVFPRCRRGGSRSIRGRAVQFAWVIELRSVQRFSRTIPAVNPSNLKRAAEALSGFDFALVALVAFGLQEPGSLWAFGP
jgi:hypothetical protein